METIIVTNFAVESQAYQAFSDLKNSMVNPLSSISQAALVSKVDGQVKILDEVDNSSNDETIVGGIVGGLIGMLAGPIGLLFGGAIGALAGAAIDDNADDNESLLIEQVMQDITCADGVTLVAFGTEQVDRFYDDIMAKFESRTTRYDAAEVRDEMNLANQMQEDFQREAREQIKAKKKARHNQVKDHFTNDATKDDKQEAVMKTNRALSFIAGIILAIIGIYLLFVPSLNLFSLSWLIAVAFLVGALAEIIYYFSDSGEFRSIWGLCAAIVSAIFGIYLLSGYFLTLPILMPTVIGFWLLILGIVRLFQSIGTSTSLPELSNNLLWTSIGMIILGIVLMFNPLLASIVVAYIVAIALIYQGFVLMIDAFKR